jgi:two-component system NtrC family sensor kinase
MAGAPRSTVDTPRKRPGGSRTATADAAARKKQRQPKRSGMLSDWLASAIRDCAVSLDADLNIVEVNAAFANQFGEPGSGVSLRAIFDPPGLKEAIADAARNGRAVRDVELQMIELDNSESTYMVTVSPIEDPSTGARLLVLIDDVTGSVDQRDRIVANTRMVTIGQMAAGVAHELNNPLTAVLGFAQLAMRQATDPTLRRDLEAIATEAERAGKIVDNLLSFARSERGGDLIFDAAGSIRRILELREYECRVNNIEVVTYLDPEAPLTRADSHQMEQVFLNLLTNSIQAIADGPGRGTVSVGLVAINDRLRISFTDDGPGIPDEVLPRLFEPFFTTKPVGKGTGLGLSICRQIIEDHEGEIRVESHPRRGTTFVIELPVVEIATPSGEVSEQADKRRSYTMLRVLAVDDEPGVTELLSRALGGLGHTVDTTRDGAQALRMIHLADYDAIVLDIKMPGLGGPEVYRCIEGLRPDLADRVMFVTGDTVSTDTRDFLHSTGRPVLHKPFSLDELRNHMEEFAAAKDERIALPANGGRYDTGKGATRIRRRSSR